MTNGIGVYIKCSNVNEHILIDREDYEKVAKFKWHKAKDHNGNNYFRYQTSMKMDNKRKTVPIHRFILDFPQGLVDHINRDTSDNRKCNLRVTSREVNSTNCKLPITNKTGVRGVCKRGNKFIAQISVKNQKIYLGIYKDIEEAKIAYIEAIKKYKPFIDISRLNF